jgi:hypothetical protein
VAKTYRIRIVWDDTQVAAAHRRVNQAFAGSAAAAQKAADAQEKAAKRAADAAAREADRAARARQKGLEKAARDADKAVEREAKARERETGMAVRDFEKRSAAQSRESAKAAAAAQRSADQMRRQRERDADKEVRDAERKAAQLDQMQDRMILRDTQRRARYEAQKQLAADRANKKILTDEQVAQAARNKLIAASNKQRVDAATDAAGFEKEGFLDGVLGATQFGAAVTGAGAALLALRAGKDVVDAVVDSIVQAKKGSQEMARQVLDTAAALREIAAIKEKFAPDEAELAQHIGVRKASGLTQAQAIEYQTELYNALGTVSKKRFDEKERAKLELEAAPYVARTGRTPEDAKARGSLLGLLPDYVKPGAGGKVQAKDVVETADKVDVILGRGAADQRTMTDQYRQLLTATTAEEKGQGLFSDPAQAAALTAVASKFDREAPATAALQAIRQARGFTKFRKTPGTLASQAATLSAAKIEEHDDPLQAMMKLFKYADENFKGEAFDTALARRGFRDQTGNKRLLQFYQQYKQGNLQEITALAAQPVVPGAAEAKNQAFLNSDVGRDLVGSALVDAAKVERGKLGKALELGRKPAEAQLITEGVDDTTAGAIRQRIAGLYTLGKASGRDVLVEQRARRDAERAAGVQPGMLQRGIEATPWLGQVNAAGQYLFGRNEEYLRYLAQIADATKSLASQGLGAEVPRPGPAVVPAPQPLGPRPAPPGGAGRP